MLNKYIKTAQHIMGVEKIKVLIGSAHSDGREEVEEVTQILSNVDFTTMGLELPEDYLLKDANGLITPFFGDLASSFSAQGKKVVPLEDNLLHARHFAIEVALSLRDSRLDWQEFKRYSMIAKRDLGDPKSPQDMLYRASLKLDMCKAVLEILDRAKSFEEVDALWLESARNRIAHNLKVIRRDNLDVVVAGDGHAKALREDLPDYKYFQTAAAARIPAEKSELKLANP